jgi:hypothetical protein
MQPKLIIFLNKKIEVQRQYTLARDNYTTRSKTIGLLKFYSPIGNNSIDVTASASDHNFPGLSPPHGLKLDFDDDRPDIYYASTYLQKYQDKLYCESSDRKKTIDWAREAPIRLCYELYLISHKRFWVTRWSSQIIILCSLVQAYIYGKEDRDMCTWDKSKSDIIARYYIKAK